MSFQNDELDKVQNLGLCRLICRAALQLNNSQIIQVCCLSDHVAIVNSPMQMVVYEFSTALACREMSDTIHVARIGHDDSIVFLTTFGSLHYLPISAEDGSYSASDAYLCKIPSLENVSHKDKIELQVDYSRSLIVLVVFGEVYILNTTLKATEDNPQNVVSVLSMAKYSVADTPNYPIINKNVNFCRYWGRGSSSVLAFGTNSEQIELWPIHATKNQDYVEWRRRREKNAAFSAQSPHRRVERVIRSELVHSHWISALSIRAPHHHESNSGLYASGDESGLVVFWKLEEVPETGASVVAEGELSNLEAAVPHTHQDVSVVAIVSTASPELMMNESSMEFGDSQIHYHSHASHNLQLRSVGKLAASTVGALCSSVSSIVSCGDDKFWVAYSTGVVCLVMLVFDPAREVYVVTKLRSIATMLAGGISDVVWRRMQTETDLEAYKLFVCAKSGGHVYEYDLPHNINQVMMLYPQSSPLPPFLVQEDTSTKSNPVHRSNVEACDFCESLLLLATACCDGLVSIWDVSSGLLLTTFKTIDLEITKLSIFEDYTDKDQGLTVVVGCRNGIVYEYFVGLNLEFLRTRRRSVVRGGAISLVSSITPQANVQELLMTNILDAIDDRSLFSRLSNEDSASVFSKFTFAERLPAMLVENVQHSCLPVSDILLSSSKRNAAYCYARVYVVVHSRQHRRVLLHLQLDNPLQSVSRLVEINDEDDNEVATSKMKTLNKVTGADEDDNLMLILQGSDGLKLLNATTKHVDAEVKLSYLQSGESNTTSTVLSIVWGVREYANSGDASSVMKSRKSVKFNTPKPSTKLLKTSSTWSVCGLAVNQQFVDAEPVSVCMFGPDGACSHSGKSFFASEIAAAGDDKKPVLSPFCTQIIGSDMTASSPVAAVWTARTALAMRVISSVTDKVRVLRSVLFKVGNGTTEQSNKLKARVVFCRGLQMQPNSKFSQMIIVLSDGYCTIVNV
jgi:WD40 repeat protein